MSGQSEKAMHKTMQWLHTWGFGHEHPQLVISGVIPVNAAEQREIEAYYKRLPKELT